MPGSEPIRESRTIPWFQSRVSAEAATFDMTDKLRLDDLKRLSYTKGLMKEAMRLYPVSPFLTRITQSDTKVCAD